MDKDHPAIVALSRHLRSIAPAYAARSHRYRNPHGAARKVWHFVAKKMGDPDRASSAVEEAVWQEFARDPRGLRTAALEIVLATGGDLVLPSRGPAPWSGTSVFAVRDSAAWLYLAQLDQLHSTEGPVFLKIGHSVDVGRRARELNLGFPPHWGTAWRMLGRWSLPNRTQAFVSEQRALRAAARAGVSAGGEFLSVSVDQVESWIDRCAKIAAVARHDCKDEFASFTDGRGGNDTIANDDATRATGAPRRCARPKRRTYDTGGSYRRMIKRKGGSRRPGGNPRRLAPAAKGEKP